MCKARAIYLIDPGKNMFLISLEPEIRRLRDTGVKG